MWSVTKAGLPESPEELTKRITRGFIVELLNVVIINPIIQVGGPVLPSSKLNLNFGPGFLEFWLAGSLFRLSFRSQHRPPWGTGIGDEWGTRSVSRFLTFIHFPPFLHQSLLDKAFSKGHLLPTMLSLFYTFTPPYFYTFTLPGRDHEHLPSSYAASRPCFPKCKLQKVCKPLPQARTLSRCLSGEKLGCGKM